MILIYCKKINLAFLHFTLLHEKVGDSMIKGRSKRARGGWLMLKKRQNQMMVNLKLPGYIWALPILPAMIFIKWEYGVALSFLINLIAFSIIYYIFVLTVKTIVETALEFYIQRMETGEDETESGGIYRLEVTRIDETQIQQDEREEKDSV